MLNYSTLVDQELLKGGIHHHENIIGIAMSLFLLGNVGALYSLVPSHSQLGTQRRAK